MKWVNETFYLILCASVKFNAFHFIYNFLDVAVIARHFQIYRRNGNELELFADVPGVDIIKSNRHLTVMIQVAKSEK